MSFVILCTRRSVALSIRAVAAEVGLQWQASEVEPDRFIRHLEANKPLFAVITEHHLDNLALFEALDKVSPQTVVLVCVTDTDSDPTQLLATIDKLDIDELCTLPELMSCLAALTKGSYFRSGLLPAIATGKRTGTLPGFADLTHAQRRVLAASCELRPVTQMADRLCLSERTINNHRYEISQKLQVGGGPGSLTRYIATHREQLLQLLAEAETK